MTIVEEPQSNQSADKVIKPRSWLTPIILSVSLLIVGFLSVFLFVVPGAIGMLMLVVGPVYALAFVIQAFKRWREVSDTELPSSEAVTHFGTFNQRAKLLVYGSMVAVLLVILINTLVGSSSSSSSAAPIDQVPYICGALAVTLSFAVIILDWKWIKDPTALLIENRVLTSRFGSRKLILASRALGLVVWFGYPIGALIILVGTFGVAA
jgi:ABC-type multidrug transport system permease subunit